MKNFVKPILNLDDVEKNIKYHYDLNLNNKVKLTDLIETIKNRFQKDELFEIKLINILDRLNYETIIIDNEKYILNISKTDRSYCMSSYVPRNPNLQLRSEPPIKKMEVSPWNMSTIGPDMGRRPLEIGTI